MSIITTMLKEKVVYWAPTGFDASGQPTWTPTPVILNARWQHVHVEFRDPENEVQMSNALVFVDADVEVQGVLLLIAQGSTTIPTSVDQADPKANDDAWEIKQFEKIPNFKATEFLRKVLL